MNKSNLNVGYISGIDGLRAVAVLAVVIYHLDFSSLPGGFTGVDVFFVISGYVISRSLANSSSPNFVQFLMSFYRRRIIRIFPALLLCLVVSSILSTLFIPSAWLSETNPITALAAFFGISNFALVIFTDGYFAPRGEFNPFLHTWSLAVEEQFYVIFPLLFYGWLNFRKQSSVVGFICRNILFVLTIASITYSYFETSNNPDWAFYLLPSRFWELAAGAFLYKFHSNGYFVFASKIKSNVCLISGICFLVFGFFYTTKSAFPFPWVIPPIVGTLLLLMGVFNNGENKPIVQAVLESKVATYTGKISYSLYLWHWPVYSLFRWTVGLEETIYMIGAMIISFLFAIASYHFVEFPVRASTLVRNQKNSKLILIGFGTICLSCLMTAGIFYSQPVISLSKTKDKFNWYPYKHEYVNTSGSSSYTDIADKKIFVIGDSHAGAYSTMLNEFSIMTGVEVVIYSKGGCSGVNLLEPMTPNSSCENFVLNTLKTIETNSKPGDIVMFASLRMKRLGDQWVKFDEQEIALKQMSERAIKNRARAMEQASKLIDRLDRKQLQVVIDAPKPVFRIPSFRCSDWFNKLNPICSPGSSISRQFLLKHRQPVMDSLKVLESRHKNLTVWDPFFELCKNETCTPFEGEQPLFFDGDHLSAYGNRVLLPSFKDEILKVWRVRLKKENT